MKSLSVRARFFVIITILVGFGTIAWDISQLTLQDPWMLLALSIVASLSLLFKVEGATNRLHYNISLLVYAFTMFRLGLQAAIVVIVVSHIVEWVWHKYPWYIQSFNISSYVLAFQAGGLAHIVFSGNSETEFLAQASTVLAVLVIVTLVNHFLVGMVVWLARGETFKESGIFNFLPLMIDLTMLCIGLGMELIWSLNPYLTPVILIPLYLIYHSLQIPALERKTETDPKTGLYNARYFENALNEELNRAERFERPLTVVMADLDLLRNINNTYGHLAGDVVLIGIAKILKGAMREYDIVARFGGEEFSIMLPEVTPYEVFERIEEIRKKVEETEFTVSTSVTPIRATISFGVAGRESDGQTASEIMHNADVALYHAKLRGRNRVFVHSNADYQNIFSTEKGQINLISESDKISEVKMAPSQNRTVAEPEPVPERARESGESEIEIPAFETSQAIKRPGWYVNAYIGVMSAITITILGIIVKFTLGFDWIGLSMFAMIVLAAEWLSIDIYAKNSSISTSAVAILAGILLFGPVGALVLSLAFAIASLLKHRSKFNRFFFNFSNQAFAGLIYLFLLSVSGFVYADQSPWVQVVICLVSMVIVYASTTLSVSLAMHLDTGAPIMMIWNERFRWLAPYYLTMGLIGFGLSYAYLQDGLWGLTVVIVPLFLLRVSQDQYITRTKNMVQELKEKNEALEITSREIHNLNEALHNAFAEVIDLRDPYVFGHSKQVSQYSVMIAEKLGLSEQKIEAIRKASLMHDIGKVGIPDSILSKPGKLTPEEYDVMQNHPTLGASLLQTSPNLDYLIPIVLHHHERFDGKGYPSGLEKDDIPIEARILAVADAVESMASDRPYRNAMTVGEICAEIERNSGTQFDPVVASAMLELLQENGNEVFINTADRYKSERPVAEVEIIQRKMQGAELP